MYASEYLRNKKRAMTQVVGAVSSRPSTLWTQIVRYKAAAPTGQRLNGGQMTLLSSAGVLATKGNIAVCCGPTVTKPATIAPSCCNFNNNLVEPLEHFPVGFYGATRPDCCPINGPSIAGQCVDCPIINTSQVNYQTHC